jgi:hypothetical protein
MADQSTIDAESVDDPAAPVPRADAPDDSRLDALLNRIQQLTSAPPTPPPGPTPIEPIQPIAASRPLPQENICPEHEGWAPLEPENLTAAGLNDGEVEALILKTLNSRSESTGRTLAEQLKLSFRLVDSLLQSMKQDRLLGHKGSAMANDYVYQMTELGRERAKNSPSIARISAPRRCRSINTS